MRLTTRARALPCPRCHATIVRGLTDPPAAWTALTDPVPLGAAQEAAALINGRFTYDLITTARPRLIYRDQFRITERNWPVLATHTCPGPVPWVNIPPSWKEGNDDSGTIPF
jgi:hypothetical protein